VALYILTKRVDTMRSSVTCAAPFERTVTFVGGRDGRPTDGELGTVSLGSAGEAITLADEVEALRAERDALQRRIDDYSHRFENLTQARDDFIAAASHELKSPLTSIHGGAQYIERLLRTPAPDVDTVVGWARVIQDQARVMRLLIDDLLDASRIRTGAFDLRLAPCEMNACVAAAVGRLGPDLRARVNVVPSSTPANGYWDRQRLEQVLANLLDNALKYSPGGEPVSVQVEAGAEAVEVSVADHGVGVPPAELPRVFERFYRTPDARAGGFVGTGLGLFICERIIGAHGGCIWAESDGAGMGSTFHFALPLQPATRATPGSSEGRAR
jgi:two-component system, OmpR family, sensor histidine kinase VicK